MSFNLFLAWPIFKLVLGIGIVALVLHYVISLVAKRRRFVRLIDQLPGEKCLPIIGNALEILLSPSESITNIFRKTTSYFPDASIIRLWIFHRPLVFVLKAVAAEVILNNPRYIRKADGYSVLHPWLGLGLLTSDNPRWKIHRKLLTPSFHFRILEEFNPIFNEQSEILLSTFEKYKNREPFDMYRHITLCTLDVICEAAMGKRLEAQTKSDSKYIEAIETYKKMTLQMFLQPWLQVPWIRRLTPFAWKLDGCIKTMHAFSNNVIKEKKQLFEIEKKMKKISNDDQYACGQKKRMAFLDTLLEALDKGEGKLTDEEIREEVDTFMFEGHDTTATAITCALFLLGWHDEAQEKVFDEINQEAIRLIPPVPVFARSLIEDVTIDGYKVPAGTEVIICPYNIHILSIHDVYLNPAEFRPERFLSESWQKRHPYAYIPFSAGSRNCIGQKFAQMEEKVILAQILRRYRIVPHQILDKDDLVATLVTTPKNGLIMALEKR